MVSKREDAGLPGRVRPDAHLIVKFGEGRRAWGALLCSFYRYVLERVVGFFEPKVLYRIAEEDVPVEDFEIPLGKAEVITEGTDLTIIGYGL